MDDHDDDDDDDDHDDSCAPPPPPPSSPSSVGRIRRLSAEVRNRIAAGEVVQRPCNALKELLENSLDAGCDTVSVLLHRGGLRLLQIADNGHGIPREDLALLCERHATSKLRTFDDLRRIQTYGFRGEALASISMVAYVSVTSKTRQQGLAYRAEYVGGRPREVGGGGGGGRFWQAMAGSDGTVLRVENMFYNTPTRRQAMSRDSEELRRCVDVAKRYALHNHLVSVTLRREGDEIVFQTTRSRNQRDTVRTLFSREVERELLEVELDSGRGDSQWQFSAKALVSNTGRGWRDTQGSFILFINNRLVQHRELKRSVLAVYEHYLRRGDHPWVYISLEIDPRNVDVNIHPTKNEVAFNPSDIIIKHLCGAIRQKLLESHQSRTFYPSASLPVLSTDAITSVIMQPPATSAGSTQSLSQQYVPPQTPPPRQRLSAATHHSSPSSTSSQQQQQRVLPQYMVRTTDQDQLGQMELYLESAAYNSPVDRLKKRIAQTPGKSKQVQLHSVLHLRSALDKNCHAALGDLFRTHTYVGWINAEYSLVQHLTKLYLVKNYELSRELGYQMVLQRFQGMKKIRMSQPINVREMILCMIVNTRSNGDIDRGSDPEREAERHARLLTDTQFTEMLDEYFSIEFKNQELVALPQVFDNHIPPLHRLPEFLYSLAAEVDWKDEQRCFEGIARQLAAFYAVSQQWELDMEEEEEEEEEERINNHQGTDLGDGNGGTYGGRLDQMAAGYTRDKVKWITQHVVFPSAKLQLRPPQEFARDYVVREIACLSQLYKVFERC